MSSNVIKVNKREVAASSSEEVIGFKKVLIQSFKAVFGDDAEFASVLGDVTLSWVGFELFKKHEDSDTLDSDLCVGVFERVCAALGVGPSDCAAMQVRFVQRISPAVSRAGLAAAFINVFSSFRRNPCWAASASIGDSSRCRKLNYSDHMKPHVEALSMYAVPKDKWTMHNIALMQPGMLSPHKADDALIALETANAFAAYCSPKIDGQFYKLYLQNAIELHSTFVNDAGDHWEHYVTDSKFIIHMAEMAIETGSFLDMRSSMTFKAPKPTVLTDPEPSNTGILSAIVDSFINDTVTHLGRTATKANYENWGPALFELVKHVPHYEIDCTLSELCPKKVDVTRASRLGIVYAARIRQAVHFNKHTLPADLVAACGQVFRSTPRKNAGIRPTRH